MQLMGLGSCSHCIAGIRLSCLRRAAFSGYLHSCSSSSSTSSTSHAPAPVPVASDVRLRFAPSPTGSLHLGGLRTALFNHLLARKLGGQWLLRIEDTDRTRFVPGAQEEQMRCLEWAGLHFDEGPGREGTHGPYIQSQRRHIYDRHLNHLLEKDHAYRCFCSAKRLDALRMEARRTKSPTHYDGLCRHLPQREIDERLAKGEPFVVRFRSKGLPEEQHDLVYGLIKLPNLQQEDFILIKSDGIPTYHFANVVDDHEMRISHILRGEEWIPSTPKHLALYSAFGWEPPRYAHMPILVNPDGTKLSKRSGDVKVLDYINNGWEPEALVNFVALMGSSWHGSTAADGTALSEVMTMDQLIDNFSLESINKHRSTMFAGKLAYLNKAHMLAKAETKEGFRSLATKAQAAVEAALPKAGKVDVEYAGKALLLVRDRIETVSDLPLACPYLFVKPDYNSKEAIDMRAKMRQKKWDVEAVLNKAITTLDSVEAEDFGNEAAVTEALHTLSQQEEVYGAALMTPLRYALTGFKSGPGVGAIMAMLGKAETLARLTPIRDIETRLV